MSKRSKHTRPWRVLWLIPVAVVAALSIVATGGGGGGDDGADDVEPPLVILPNYNFILANLNDGELLTADVGGQFTVTIDIDGLFFGNLDLDVGANDTVTFLSYIIRDTNRIDLTVASPGGSPLDGTFAVLFTADINAAVGDAPTSGSFNVVTQVETVTVTILANGVQLALNSGMPIDYTWDEFTSLLDDDLNEPWQRRASLAGGAIEFIIEQFFNVAGILGDLELVTLNNPYDETCDMFTTGGPPLGVLPQGMVTVTWLGSGELSDGDDFTWEFNDCWSLDDEELLDGTVTLEDYTESVDFNTGVLFNIGFGGLGAGAPGGVIFDLTFSETVQSDGAWTIPAGGVVALSGGFVLNIQQP